MTKFSPTMELKYLMEVTYLEVVHRSPPYLHAKKKMFCFVFYLLMVGKNPFIRLQILILMEKSAVNIQSMS